MNIYTYTAIEWDDFNNRPVPYTAAQREIVAKELLKREWEHSTIAILVKYTLEEQLEEFDTDIREWSQSVNEYSQWRKCPEISEDDRAEARAIVRDAKSDLRCAIPARADIVAAYAAAGITA